MQIHTLRWVYFSNYVTKMKNMSSNYATLFKTATKDSSINPTG